MVARRRKGLSPRYLTFRHSRCLLRRQGLLSCDEEYLEPGEQRLRSFHRPGLLGGEYIIDVEQDITVSTHPPKSVPASQSFYVNYPQFQLPDGAIHSVYPPQGHEEWVTALPHVVFNNPSLPWEWEGSFDEDPIDYKQNRNRVPWLAVLVFTQEELELSSTDLEGPQSIFRDIFPDEPPRQTSTLAVNMPASQIKKIKDTAAPSELEKTSDDTTTDVILLRRELFASLFTKYDVMGNPVPNAGPDVRPYRFLAHRRDINTEGMAYAALTATEDDQSSFGVVFSHRTGPLQITEPTICMVHLVSLIGVEGMSSWPIPNDRRFVAMSSLHSWSYSCFPPDTPTVRDQFEALGASCHLLRYNFETGDEKEIKDYHASIGNRAIDRLHNGYTLARYRVQTGESTACFMRGAFVPVTDHAGAEHWTWLSNNGSDLQILDQRLGVMDITYSAAWQLGRSLAISDPTFVASLGRVRKQIYDRGMQSARLAVLSRHGVRQRSQLIAALPSIVDTLHRLSDSQALRTPDYLARSRRWHRPAVEPIDLSYQGQAPGTRSSSGRSRTLADDFTDAAKQVAGAYDENNPDTPLPTPYNEFNLPFSTDWMVVLKWVLDRLVFSNIPTQYLVTDSSHLPLESIRFFQVDTRWMNAMLDGALSLANYLRSEDDPIRGAIFEAINWYRDTPIPDIQRTSPIPLYGCYVRSVLVTKFPDLRVEIYLNQTRVDELQLLRHEIVNGDTMLCLFAHGPSASTFNEIRLTQPPHQETFVAADTVDRDHIQMTFKKAYTVRYDGDDVRIPIGNPKWRYPTTKSGEDAEDEWEEDDAVFLWDYPSPSNRAVEARRLLMDNLADKYLTTVRAKMDRDKFNDTIATSALMGRQMASSAWQLNYAVEYIVISLALGSLEDTPACLMESYIGPGAYMLTNVRFNPVVSIDTTTNKLLITLLPRTSPEGSDISYVHAGNCGDLSFVLSGVTNSQSSLCNM
ncbi:hypothetical protein BDV28DRAFT_154359 [Aspergillus coremiiformis]|uniref:Uncharacterized protein n=1 Tax=Aspergillus coremiiformis TaxID=138285 RepID=A0A5N6ZIT5_9EURO|nr:hypothetical protein BDV28DRAFT_154359 [Aspergillus coremiiformis]